MRLTALVCLLASASAPAQTWRELGPAPTTGFSGATGRISAMACSPTNPDLYFAAGADGGVWRTTDGGATWVPLSDQMPTTSIGALALDPANPAVIYAGTGEANFANHSRYGLGLLRSTDSGQTWALLAPGTFAGRCFSRIVISPQGTLYASTTQAGGFPELAAAKGHPQGAGPRGVFRSSDGGQTWTQLGGGLPNQDATDLAMDPTNPAIMYAAIGRIFGAPENGIYKSSDGGDTWVRLGGGLPTANVGRISIAIAPSNPQRLYALVARNCTTSGGSGDTLAALRSDNAGATWTTIPAGSFQATYGWYLSVVLVHPTNPDTVFMGGLNLVRSTNAGAAWSTVTPPHVDMHALAFDASGRLLSGDDGGIHRSVNLGSAWTSLNTGVGTIQFYAGVSTHPTNEHFVIGGTQDNGTNRRTTDTLLWGSVLGGDGGWTQVDQADPMRVFAEFQGIGAFYRSTNGGASFSAAGSGISGRLAFFAPYLIDPANPQRMLYGTERVWLSTNGGTSFTPHSPDLTAGGAAAIRSLAMAPSDSAFVYAATNDSRVLSSDDGGATFTLRLTDAEGWPRVTRELFVDPTDARTVYLAGATFGRPHVRRSRDAGATWATLDGPLPDIPINTVAADSRFPAPVIFAGADDGLYRSVNEGVSWRRYGQGLPRAPVIDIYLDRARERLVIATQGRGAWSVPLAYCYADFDDDGALNVNDFMQFLNAYAASRPQANCDLSTVAPVLNVNDFVCFMNRYAAGCP